MVCANAAVITDGALRRVLAIWWCIVIVDWMLFGCARWPTLICLRIGAEKRGDLANILLVGLAEGCRLYEPSKKRAIVHLPLEQVYLRKYVDVSLYVCVCVYVC